MTKKEALEMTLEIWQWLADNPDKEKGDFPKFKEYEIEQMCNYCPLCERYNNCMQCPIYIYDGFTSCLPSNSAFNLWAKSLSRAGRKLGALRIVKACKKALESEMADKERKELNERLTKWVGLKISGTYPDKYYYKTWRKKLPNFTNSLDACFKWLVPNKISEIAFTYARNFVYVEVYDMKSVCYNYIFYTESLEESYQKTALALCLAIEKLLESEK